MGSACLAAAVPAASALENTQCLQLYVWIVRWHDGRAQRETRARGPPQLPNKCVGDQTGLGAEGPPSFIACRWASRSKSNS
jgi:hypothetical protein